MNGMHRATGRTSKAGQYLQQGSRENRLEEETLREDGMQTLDVTQKGRAEEGGYARKGVVSKVE